MLWILGVRSVHLSASKVAVLPLLDHKTTTPHCACKQLHIGTSWIDSQEDFSHLEDYSEVHLAILRWARDGEHAAGIMLVPDPLLPCKGAQQFRRIGFFINNSDDKALPVTWMDRLADSTIMIH